MSSPNRPTAMVIGDIYNRPWQELARETIAAEGWQANTYDDPQLAYERLLGNVDALVITSMLNGCLARRRTRVTDIIVKSQELRIPVALILDEYDTAPQKITGITRRDEDIYIPKSPFDKIAPSMRHWLNPVVHGVVPDETARPRLEVIVSPVVLHHDQVASSNEMAEVDVEAQRISL